MSKKFTDVRATKATDCLVCGEPGNGRVRLMLMELNPRAYDPGKTITSFNPRLCEEHAVALYELLRGEIAKWLERGGQP